MQITPAAKNVANQFGTVHYYTPQEISAIRAAYLVQRSNPDNHTFLTLHEESSFDRGYPVQVNAPSSKMACWYASVLGDEPEPDGLVRFDETCPSQLIVVSIPACVLGEVCAYGSKGHDVSQLAIE